jgi:hypothetical protein
MNEGQAFFQSLNAAQCTPLTPWLDTLQFTVGLTLAVASGNFIAGEARAFFSWLLPVIWAAAARQFTRQPKEQNP